MALALIAFFQICARLQLSRQVPRGTVPWPPITVLKPIKGADDGLYDNLVAMAEQDYPCFEILIAVADVDDPACVVVRRLQRAYPQVAIRLVTGAPDLGLNPKVSNLAHASRYAAHDCWLISDADVRPEPGYLRAMADRLASGAQLVHSVLGAAGERELGAALDNATVAGFIASSVAAGELLLDHPCVVGKSILFRRGDLEEVGGWSAFKDVLAEDYLMGQRFKAAGKKVRLCSVPVGVHVARRSVRAYVARHLRWLQMRRCMAPAVFFAQPLIYPLPPLVLVAFDRPLSAALGVSLYLSLEVAMIRRIRGHIGPRLVAALWLKDLVLLGAWIVAALRSDVVWRGRRMRIGPGTRLTKPEPAPLPTLPWR